MLGVQALLQQGCLCPWAIDPMSIFFVGQSGSGTYQLWEEYNLSAKTMCIWPFANCPRWSEMIMTIFWWGHNIGNSFFGGKAIYKCNLLLLIFLMTLTSLLVIVLLHQAGKHIWVNNINLHCFIFQVLIKKKRSSVYPGCRVRGGRWSIDMVIVVGLTPPISVLHPRFVLK